MISENGGLRGVVNMLVSGEGSQELNTVLAGILGACAADSSDPCLLHVLSFFLCVLCS